LDPRNLDTYLSRVIKQGVDMDWRRKTEITDLYMGLWNMIEAIFHIDGERSYSKWL
jgi:hypothetical protein